MKFKFTVFIVFLSLSRNLEAQNTAEIINYIRTYKDIAIDEMQRSGVPASIILAQGIHETEAGTSELVRKSNNHFGIKCKENWTGSVVYHDDDERGECFRSYDKPEDSYKDHSDFLRNSSRYGFLFKLDPTDYYSWAYGLKKAGYATNVHYPQILIKLIEDYNLEQYTLIAMGRAVPAQETLMANDQGKTLSTRPINGSLATTDKERVSVSLPSVRAYPTGEFILNYTKVFFARAGSSLLSLAGEYNISLPRLLDFNDLKPEDLLLMKDQLLFLQRKRKVGNNEFHIVREGETLYDICQTEAIRYESLLELNLLKDGEQPAVEEKLNLQNPASSRPLLAMGKSGKPSLVYQPGPGNPDARPNPPSLTHEVENGETLYSISKKYRVGPDKIMEWNKLASRELREGQELIIYKN